MTAKPGEVLTDSQTHNNDTLLRADGSRFYRLCEDSRALVCLIFCVPLGIHAATLVSGQCVR